MKILIVRTFPNFLDTTQYNVQEIGLAKALIKAGHEVGIVLYNGKKKDTVKNIPVKCGNESKEIIVYYLHGWNFLKNGIFPSLNKIVKQYEVIQVHEYDQITSWMYYAWSKKNVVIYHGPYYDIFNKGYNLKCKVFDNIFLRLKNNKDVPCLAKSYAAAEFLRSKGFNNVTAVGVGLDIDNLLTESTKKNEQIMIEEDKFTLLYVGKIEVRRNSLFLAEVIKKVMQKYDDIRCIVIGNGEKEYTSAFLNKVMPLIKKGNLAYYPSVSQMQLADLYQRVSLMLFPSNYEIFGMVLLEAAYFNLPVISSQNGGADMLIKDGENGIIITEFELNKWIAGIEKYYNKWKENNDRDKNTLNRNRDKLLWDYICKKMIDIYKTAEGSKI